MALLLEDTRSRSDHLWGAQRVVQANLSGIANGDTWVPGLNVIEHVDFTPATDSGNNAVWRVSITNRTLLFEISAGETLGGTIVVRGY